MSATAALSLVFDILARSDKASREFDKVGDDSERMGKRVGKAGDDGGRAFGGGIKSGVGLAVGALAGLGLASVFKGFIEEAAESAKIGRLTDAVIKSTGGAAKLTAEQVGDLAGAISNKTAVDDEAIQGGANLLLTFTKVRNELGKGNDIFNQATQAAVDMSVALGTDVSGASLQLGKALNDPIKGLSVLGKAGVSFTEDQKKQVKQLVATGDVLGAQKVILGELSTQFGGAAEAAADPMAKLKVTLGNLAEEIGTAVLPTVTKVATFITDKFIPGARQLIDVLFKGDFEGGPFQEDSPVVDAVFNIREAFLKLNEYIRDEVLPKLREFGTYLKDEVLPVLTDVKDFINENRDAFASLAAGIVAVTAAARIYTGIQAALNVVLLANPVGAIVAGLALLVGGLIFAYRESETFRNAVNKVFGEVKDFASEMAIRLIPVVKDFAALIQEKVTTGLELLRQKFEENRPQIDAVVAIIGKLFEGFKNVAGYVVSEMLPVLGKFVGFLVEQVFVHIGTFIDLFGTLVRAAASALSGFLGMVSGMLGGIQQVLGALAQVPGPFQDTFRRASESVGQAKLNVDTLKFGLDALPVNKNLTIGADTSPARRAVQDLLAYVNTAPSGVIRIAGVTGLGGLTERAHGGSFNAGQPYLVGELGPELVIPRSSGTVIPADRTAAALGGGGQTINVTMLRAEPESNAEALTRGLQSLAFRLAL